MLVVPPFATGRGSEDVLWPIGSEFVVVSLRTVCGAIEVGAPATAVVMAGLVEELEDCWFCGLL